MTTSFRPVWTAEPNVLQKQRAQEMPQLVRASANLADDPSLFSSHLYGECPLLAFSGIIPDGGTPKHKIKTKQKNPTT